jgi:lipopolysaccharide export LptBFGC system permease protein LptF
MLTLSLLFLPGFCLFTIPVAVLTGVLLGFGRMASDGEVAALAAAGVPPVRVCAAPLAVGLLAASLGGLVAAVVAPAAAEALHQTFVRLTRQHIAASLSPGRFFEEIPRVLLYPHQASPAGDGWDGFLVHDCRTAQRCHVLVARQARVQAREDRNALQLELVDGEIHEDLRPSQGYDLVRFSRAELGLDIDRLVASRAQVVASVERLASGRLSAAMQDPALPPAERVRLSSTWHRRLAFPLAALLFAAWGTALAIHGRLRGWRGTLIIAVASVAGYYLAMRFGDALVRVGWLDTVGAAWLPDVLLLLLACLRLARLSRRPG